MNYTEELQLKDIVKKALKEDIGIRDITTELTIPKHKFVKAAFFVKQDCVICGLGIAGLVFKIKNNKIKFKSLARDGQYIKRGKIIAKVEGEARSILSAERVALNFLSLLSGIATKTRGYVNAVKPYKTKIIDTRKTIPGLRILEKYAVRIGGGFNHRFSLDEMVMVKDNHLKVIGGYLRLAKITTAFPIELEVKNLKEFKEALRFRPDVIMLDNMSIKEMKQAVKIRNNLSLNTYHPMPKLEASGGITLQNTRSVASSGVEIISIGDLTHSIKAVDISLEIL